MTGLQAEIQAIIRAELRAALSPDDGLVTWDEAAKFLGISTRHLANIQSDPANGLRIYRISRDGARRLRRSELMAYLERIAERPAL